MHYFCYNFFSYVLMLFPKQQKILELCVQEKKVLATRDPVSTGKSCNVYNWELFDNY